LIINQAVRDRLLLGCSGFLAPNYSPLFRLLADKRLYRQIEYAAKVSGVPGTSSPHMRIEAGVKYMPGNG
jgi:hypothetical protein